MLYLDQNKTAYNEYFKWKKYVKFNSDFIHPFCDMCIKLHMESFYGIEKKIRWDIGDDNKFDKICKRPSEDKNDFFKFKNLK